MEVALKSKEGMELAILMHVLYTRKDRPKVRPVLEHFNSSLPCQMDTHPPCFPDSVLG